MSEVGKMGKTDKMNQWAKQREKIPPPPLALLFLSKHTRPTLRLRNFSSLQFTCRREKEKSLRHILLFVFKTFKIISSPASAAKENKVMNFNRDNKKKFHIIFFIT